MFRRFFLPILLVSSALSASAAAKKSDAPDPTKPMNPPGLPSILGLTAVTPRMPVTPGSAAVDWVAGIQANWGELEPTKGKLDWTPLDDRIRAVGEAGAAVIPALVARSTWGTALAPEDWPTLRREQAVTMPTDVEAWAAFVRAAAERYDGDGIEDMPGLLRPIHTWQLMPDLGATWSPGGADTIEYLKVTATALREADRPVVVVLGGINEGDIDLLAVDAGILQVIFQGKQRISRGTIRSVELLSSRVQFIRDVLGAKESYAAIDVHHLLRSDGIADRLHTFTEDLLKRVGAPGKHVVSLYNVLPSIPGAMPDGTAAASEMIRGAFGCFLGGCRRFAWPAEAAALPPVATLAPYPMVDAEGHDQPSRAAFVALGQRLRNSTQIKLWRSPEDAPNARVASVEVNPGEPFVTVWNERNNSLSATFPATGVVTVTNAVTGAARKLSAKDGKVAIEIGPIPVYVTGVFEPGTTPPAAKPAAKGKRGAKPKK